MMNQKINRYFKLSLLAGIVSVSAIAHDKSSINDPVTDSAVVTTTVTDKAPVKPIMAENDKKIQLMTKLAKLQYLSANFSQTVIDGDGNTLQSGSGKLLLSKPNLVRWETTEPDESLIVSDGDTLWFFDPFIEQVSAYKLQSAIANTPILLLTNQDQTLWNNYQVSQINQDTYLIHALDTNSQVKTLELNFDNDQLAGFVILDATGQLSRVVLSDVDMLNPPPMEKFTFVLSEGIHIDDQR